MTSFPVCLFKILEEQGHKMEELCLRTEGTRNQEQPVDACPQCPIPTKQK